MSVLITALPQALSVLASLLPTKINGFEIWEAFCASCLMPGRHQGLLGAQGHTSGSVNCWGPEGTAACKTPLPPRPEIL